MVGVASSAVAEPLLLSSQAFLLLLARSFLLWLAGRFAPCFLEVSVAALAAPPLTLHEKLSSSSPPTVSNISLAPPSLLPRSLCIIEGGGQLEGGRGQERLMVVADLRQPLPM